MCVCPYVCCLACATVDVEALSNLTAMGFTDEQGTAALKVSVAMAHRLRGNDMPVVPCLNEAVVPWFSSVRNGTGAYG